MRAARFLHGQKIFKARDLPYRTQLVPLAAIFVDLDKEGQTEGIWQRIARWYWCGVLGELYGFDDKLDIHHIFPEAWCRAAGIEPGIYNSVINKTAISARTNRQIGGRPPSVYLLALEGVAGINSERMDEILRSHCVEPTFLRADRFWDFYTARAQALLKRIGAATGKGIPFEPELFGSGAVADDYDEGPEEWDAEQGADGLAR